MNHEVQWWRRDYPAFPGVATCVALLRRPNVRGSRVDRICAELAAHAAPPDAGGDAYGYGVWLLHSDGSPRVGLEGEDPGFSARAFWYRKLGVANGPERLESTPHAGREQDVPRLTPLAEDGELPAVPTGLEVAPPERNQLGDPGPRRAR